MRLRFSGRQGLRALSTIMMFALLLAGSARMANDQRNVANAASQTANTQVADAVLAADSQGLLKQTIGPGKCEWVAVTEVTLCDVFRDYWYRYGGLAVFGYPLSWEMMENGKRVQYFERAKFEYQPSSAGTDWAVVGELLGRTLTTGREAEAPFQYIPNVTAPEGCLAFVETGHTLCNGFRQYWNRNGGLWLFGYPISQEFQERNPDDGQTYTVQYFERARFEYHPEHAGTPYEVELGRLGASVFAQRYKNPYRAIYNVRDFGAHGDGVTDDTDAITAALNAARTGKPKGIVFVPAGTYMVRATDTASAAPGQPLALGPTSILVGEDWETTTFKLIPGSILPGWRAARLLSVADGARVANLTFDGSREQIDRNQIRGLATSLVATAADASNVVLEDLRLRGAYGQSQDVWNKEAFGIACRRSNNIVVRQVEGYENDGTGISVGGDIYGQMSENALVENVLLHDNVRQGITFFGAADTVAQGIVAYGNRNGVNMEWSQNITIRDAQTYGNERRGISLWGVSTGIRLEDIHSWDNGHNYPGGSEIGIVISDWNFPDPSTGVVAAGIAQDITVVDSQLDPAPGKTNFYIEPSPSQTTVGAPVPQAIRMQSPGASNWSFDVANTVVSAADLPAYILATFGVTIQTE